MLVAAQRQLFQRTSALHLSLSENPGFLPNTRESYTALHLAPVRIVNHSAK
jgi:hypothetical protein